MKRRLTEAYDTMIMPESCTRRIEQQLTARQGRRNVEVYTPPKRNWWALAAGLVCLVLVLSAGGTFLLLNAANRTAAKTPEPAVTQPPVLETTAETSEKTMDFSLSEDGKEFLEKMCYYMPNWSVGYAPVDEDFWNEFLFASFRCPEITEDGKVLTICGEAEIVTREQKEMVKISQEAVANYVMLAMGCELPEDFRPNRVGLTYEDGFYYIVPSDVGSEEFTFRDWELLEGDRNCANVRFDVSADAEHVTGTVTFLVWRAENENGFVILDKVQKATDRQDISVIACLFADAYFSGNTDTMNRYLADSFAGTAEGYGGGENVVDTELTGLPEAREEKQVGDVVTVSKGFRESNTADSDTYLTMELIKQDNGWKVKAYGLEK